MRLAKSTSDQRVNLAPLVRKGDFVACTAPAGVAVALEVQSELARELTSQARLGGLRQSFGSAAGVPAQGVTVCRCTRTRRGATRSSSSLQRRRTLLRASRRPASARSCLFTRWQRERAAGSLAKRLGVTPSDDMPPRVAALPEFWYAKVLRGLRFRAHAVGQASDLLLVACG